MKICLLLQRQALSVPVMRHTLGDTLRALGAEDEGVSELLLAVTEACTNVVRHGGPGSRYEVMASVGRGGCRVEVVNKARVADFSRLTSHARGTWPVTVPPARAPRSGGRPAGLGRAHRRGQAATGPGAGPAGSAPDDAIAALPEGGRGLAIMRACVDDVTLSSRPEQGTVVSLRKRMEWRAGAPLGGEFADAG